MSRRDEIVDQAMLLFAERGYGKASVADIQRAAGLTAGSGALYKHFPSKEDVLRAGIDRFVASRRLDLPHTADASEVLGGVARSVLDPPERDVVAFRVSWRNLHAFPWLHRSVLEEGVQPSFADFAVWLGQLVTQGHATAADPTASAAVLLSALYLYRIMLQVHDEPPGLVPRSRFERCWLDAAQLVVATSRPAGAAEAGRGAGAPSPVAGDLGGSVPEMPERRSSRADEILEHAMRLFAERGYDSTSVGDIQVEAGMTPGSGALYKHYASKEALLEEGVTRFIEEGARAAADLPALGDEDLRATLRQVAQLVLRALRDAGPTLRIAWRDLPAFPHLNKRVLDERIQRGFDQFEEWLRAGAASGRLVVEDPAATSAVLLGSLVFHRLMESLLGEKPGGVGERRFVDAWVDAAATALEA